MGKKKKKSQKASSLPPLQASTGARSMKRRVQKEIRKHLTGAEQPRSLLNRGKNAIQRKIVCASSGCSEMSFDAKLLHYIKMTQRKTISKKKMVMKMVEGEKAAMRLQLLVNMRRTSHA